MINMWSHPPLKMENCLPKKSIFLALVPKTYPNLANDLRMLIKLSIQVVLQVQVISYLKHKVRELQGVCSSICKWTVSSQVFFCRVWSLHSFENLAFKHLLAEVYQPCYSITKYLKDLGKKSKQIKTHSKILQNLDTPSCSSGSQFAFF